METEGGQTGGSLHLLLVVCWVEAAVEMSFDRHSHSSGSSQAVSPIVVVCFVLVETFLFSQKAFDTGGLTFSVSFIDSSIIVELRASAASVKLTLEGRLVFQVQAGRPSCSSSLKRSFLAWCL